jgi:hypothetical protein
MKAQRKTWAQLERERPEDMKKLGDELRMVASRVLADHSGLDHADPRYSELVNDYYRRALLVDAQKHLHVVPVPSDKNIRPELDDLRNGVKQLALKALYAGATPNEVLCAVGTALDSAAQVSQIPIEREA